MALSAKLVKITGGHFALGQKGDTSVPLLVSGTSSNPAFRPDTKQLAAEKIQKFTGNSDLEKAGGLLNNLFGGKKKQ